MVRLRMQSLVSASIDPKPLQATAVVHSIESRSSLYRDMARALWRMVGRPRRSGVHSQHLDAMA